MIELRSRIVTNLPTPEQIDAALARGVALAGVASLRQTQDALGGRLIRRRKGKLYGSAVLTAVRRGGQTAARIGPFWFTGRLLDSGVQPHPILPKSNRRRARAGKKPTPLLRRRIKFPGPGGTVYATGSAHPGIRPRGWLRVLVNEVGPIATAIVSREINQAAATPGPRTGGAFDNG